MKVIDIMDYDSINQPINIWKNMVYTQHCEYWFLILKYQNININSAD